MKKCPNCGFSKRKCPSCKEWKSPKDFYISKTGRVQSWCRPCLIVIVMKSRKRNVEKYRKYQKEWFHKNKEKWQKYLKGRRKKLVSVV